MAAVNPPWLLELYGTGVPEEDAHRFPFHLPFVAEMALRFTQPVTFFVGENGSGKSTALEALAALAGLPPSGGGRTELSDRYAPENEAPLAAVLRAAWTRKPPAGWFFRAETVAHLASLLEDRQKDPDFWGDPYASFGGRSLHTRSHGEAFLAILQHRLQEGIVLMDEPESALSPQRQLALLARMADMVDAGKTQFIIATHSPILLTFPDAQLVDFNDPDLPAVRFEDTSHVQITRGMLEAPERYWRHLRAPAEDN